MKNMSTTDAPGDTGVAIPHAATTTNSSPTTKNKATAPSSDAENETWATLDTKLTKLAQNAAQWGASKPSERLALLRQLKTAYQTRVDLETWTSPSAAIQGWNPDTLKGRAMASAEMLVMAPILPSLVDGLMETYEEMVTGGDVYTGPAGVSLASATTLPTGRMVVPVADGGVLSKLLGMEVELVIEAGRDPATESREVNNAATNGKVCVTLGAGNQAFLTVHDCLHKLFVDGCVVMVKHHPLRTYAYGPFAAMFQPLIDAGYVQQTCCGMTEAQRLVADPRVACLHMTGGKHTHDTIVRSLEQTGHVGANEKPFTSELGNVSPYIVVPGNRPWSEDEIDRHVNMLLLMTVGQASANCNAPKVLILDDAWKQTDVFLDCIRSKLAKAMLPPLYYPGSRQRYDRFCDEFTRPGCPQVVEVLGSAAATNTALAAGLAQNLDTDVRAPKPLLLIHHEVDVDDPDTLESMAFTTEAFCPVLAVVHLGGKASNDPGVFLRRATRFCNDCLFGTLVASVIVPPEMNGNAAVEACLHDLHYGSVVVNGPGVMGYMSCYGVWGGRDTDVHNVSSGIGFVHNTKMIPGVEKAITRLPFILRDQAEFQLDGTSVPAPGRLRPRLQTKMALFLQRRTVASFLGLVWQLVFGGWLAY